MTNNIILNKFKNTFTSKNKKSSHFFCGQTKVFIDRVPVVP